MVQFGRAVQPFSFSYEAPADLSVRLQEVGVNLLIGTDASNPYVVPGFSLHDELALAVDTGLSPYQALRADTVGTAEYLGVLDQTGTVEEGKRADLVLLDDNLFDDIAHTRAIAGVMVQGSWFSNIRLQRYLDELAARYAFLGQQLLGAPADTSTDTSALLDQVPHRH